MEFFYKLSEIPYGLHELKSLQREIELADFNNIFVSYLSYHAAFRESRTTPPLYYFDPMVTSFEEALFVRAMHMRSGQVDNETRLYGTIKGLTVDDDRDTILKFLFKFFNGPKINVPIGPTVKQLLHSLSREAMAELEQKCRPSPM